MNPLQWLLDAYRKAIGGSLSAQEARNLNSLLFVIRVCEGTDGPDGYRTWFGHKLFDSYAKHPGPRMDITHTYEGKTFHPSAAGAYQILIGTYNKLIDQGIIKDFTPQSQDIAAVYLIKGRGALGNALSGQLQVCYNKLRNEWASLPGGGQYRSVNSKTKLANLYTTTGGTIKL